MKELLKHQKELIMSLNPLLIYPSTEVRRLQLLNDYLTCISSEVEEARMDLPWKHWKNYGNFKFDRAHFIEETIDILHFLLDIWLLLDLTDAQINTAYLSKKRENQRRWKGVVPQRRKSMGKKLLRPNH